MTTTITRYHDISAGHRVYGHEGACAHLHGHNYRIHFTCVAKDLDEIGRVIDFSVVKALLCEWLERNWDHKFLVWQQDRILPYLQDQDPKGVVSVPFNPTAENMAKHLVEKIGPLVLADTGVVLLSVMVDETRKCSATYSKD